MKISALMFVFFILVLAFGGACNSEGRRGVSDTKEPAKTEANKDLTTFAAQDQMTTKQQGKLLVNRTRKMYYYLEKNDPAKAQCMEDRFLGELNDKESTEGFKVFVGQVKGVPKERREKSYLEDLLAYYISEELCGDVTSKNTTP